MTGASGKSFRIRISNIIWAVCCLICCITGNAWAGSVISVCQYLLFGMLILLIIFNRLSIKRELAAFCAGIFLTGLLCAGYNVFSGFHYFNLFVHMRQVLYFLLFAYCGYYIAYNNRDSDLIVRTIHYISLIAAYMVILQGALQAFGIYLNRLSFFGETIFHATDTSRYFRPSAFFSEPSYFAEICLIDIFYCLFKKRNLKVVLIEAIALALSTSALGIVFSYSLFVAWACTQKITKNQLIDLFIKTAMIALLLAAAVIFLSYRGDSAIILRIQRGATIRQRTLRAFEIFGKLDDGHKFFGIGMQNLTNYLNAYSVRLVNDGADTILNKEFAQSFGYILCALGIPGAVVFAGFLTALFCKCKGNGRFILILIAELCLTANLITRLIFTIYIAAVYQMIFEGQGDSVILNEQ